MNTVVKKTGMNLNSIHKKKDISNEVTEAFGSDTVAERNKKQTRAVKKVNTGASNSQVVRDSFTMPDYDYVLIEKTKTRLMKKGVLLNKAEVLRAGLHALKRMSDKDLLDISEGVEKIKTGRPAE
jgi:hypothetical protein